MIQFGESVYYIDLKAFDRAVSIIEKKELTTDPVPTEKEIKITTDKDGNLTREEYQKTTPKSKEMDIAKYDILRDFINYIIDSDEITDDSKLGGDGALVDTSFGYKLVFNTLYKEGIIKEEEIEED
jgi:hypothetical protein